MKGGSCIFFPKYYLNVDQDSVYSKKLFMDYIQGETLDAFLDNNQNTISLFSKVFILLQIIQACRFLMQFGIVHLDLKELNIIVTKRMGIKLIDFGESYQYDICGKDFKPKFSIPYAAPQIVSSSTVGRGFTEKSDIYSFGILMHNLLFGKMPYELSKDKFFETNR